MNRVVASRFMALRQAVMRQTKRNGSGGHHEIVNCGPPVTLDYMPVPSQSYKLVYGELQAKFNTYLAFSAVLFVGAFSYALFEDVFSFESVRPPKSYRNRQ